MGAAEWKFISDCCCALDVLLASLQKAQSWPWSTVCIVIVVVLDFWSTAEQLWLTWKQPLTPVRVWILAVYDDLMLARSAVQNEWATVRTIYISARVWIILTFEPLTQLLIHCSACIVQTRRTCTGDDVGSEWWTTGCLMSRQAQTYTIINNLLYADNIVFSASKNVRYMLRNVRHPHSIMLISNWITV